MALDNSLQNLIEPEFLSEEDRMIVVELLSIIESPSFNVNTFFVVVDILSRHITSPEFVGLDKTILSSEEALINHPKDEEGKYLRDLISSQRASDIVDVIFDHPKVIKYWRIVNAAKIEAALGIFCKELHQTQPPKSSLKDYLKFAHRLAYVSLFNLEKFTIENSKIEVLSTTMENLGMISLLRFHRVLILTKSFCKTSFNIRGIETFSLELDMIIKEALKNNANLIDKIDESFSPTGVLYRIMRISLFDIPDALVEDVDEIRRSVAETQHVLDTETYSDGLCPAALTKEYNGETLPLAQIYARVILSEIPESLKKPL